MWPNGYHDLVIRVAGKIILHTSALVIGLGVLLVIAIGGAAYRLSQGPVSIGFLAPYIEDALKGEDGGYGLLVDDTIITWGGWEKTLEIRVRGLRILNQARSIVATVPEATLDLSGRALFRGMLAPTRLELIGPDVRMVRLPDGRVVFGISDADDFASDPAQAEVFRKILRELTGPPNLDRPLGFLRQITVSRADLAIYDRPSKTIWRGPGTHLNLTRDVDGISGSLSTGLLLSDNIWRLNATGNYNSETEVAHLNIAFGDIDLAMLAREYEVFSALAPVEMPVSGSLSFDVGTGGSSPDAPTFAFDVSGGPGRLVLPDVYEAPVQLDAVSARGRLEQISGQVVIEDLYAAAGSAELAAQGLLFYGPEDARGAIIDVNFGGLPVEDLKKYWPSDAKPRSRKWIV